MEQKQKEINYDITDEDNKKILLYEINNHLLLDEKPSEFFEEIADTPLFNEYPFTMLKRLRETEQSPQHHPEGNVWNHTMLVLDQAAKQKHKSKNDRVFMWAALLHDIGKPDTTKNRKGKITSYDHEKVGANLAKDFLGEFSEDIVFINKVSVLIRYHMQILHVVKNLPFADIQAMKQESDVKEVALLGYCDRLGRTNVNVVGEKKNIEIFLQKCENF